MTPQETQLVTDLFDRLAQVESAPRDAAAEQLIADGLQQAPHAVYALVQTVLVQDEALKRANARIEELQAQMSGGEAEGRRPTSFLDAMREAVTGRAAAHGSVPSVRAAAPAAQPQNFQSHEAQSQSFQPQPGSVPPSPSGYPGGAPFAPGGSFLGNAASTAAGVIGGSLLLNSIRSAFGQRAASPEPGKSFAGNAPLPWSNKAESGGAGGDQPRGSSAHKASDQADDPQNDQSDNVESVADADDAYDFDNDELGEDDFDGDDPDSDSYDE